MADGGAAAPERLSSKLLLRGKTGIEVLDGPPANARAALRAEEARTGTKPELDAVLRTTADDRFAFDASSAAAEVAISPDGTLLATAINETGIRVQDLRTSEVVMEVAHPGIVAMTFSPLGTSLLTWQRPQKAGDGGGGGGGGGATGNLIVWTVASGAIAARFNQRSFRKDHWPTVTWTSDEALAARCVTNEVHIYNGSDVGAGLVDKLIRPGVTVATLAPGPAPYKLAAFVAEAKGRPAIVSLFAHPHYGRPVCSQSFFRAQDIALKWSPAGTAVLAFTSTDVDATGKSYYGETGLYLLREDGESCAVAQQKEGPMYDVAWGPTGRNFVVVAGSMPARSTLYDAKCKPIFDFGAAPRNIVAWSPHGRFLCLAGFGNLPGEMDFWDTNKLKRIGSAMAHGATSHAWSPDSRYFLTATLHPRLRVDNGFKLWRYDGGGINGDELFTVNRDELYEVQWQGAAAGVFPDRPASPVSRSVPLTTPF